MNTICLSNCSAGSKTKRRYISSLQIPDKLYLMAFLMTGTIPANSVLEQGMLLAAKPWMVGRMVKPNKPCQFTF